MIYNIKYSDGNRNELIKYILENKKRGKFTVIDIGGGVTSWSYPYVDAIIDFNDLINNNQNIKHFRLDITEPDNYNDILEYVNENGKFDFCICSHTLEDIINPIYVCKQICKISKEGYIAFPSIYRELSRFEGKYRGYIHHRYFFVEKNNNIIAYPKINYIENNNEFDKIAILDENIKDFSFFWKGKIEINYINNNYLGPNVDSVINYYNDLFEIADLYKKYNNI